MAAMVGKYAANKMLKKQMGKFENKNVSNGEDPYFAYVEDPRKPGKLRKVKKQIPAYIPEHDANVLAAVRRRAYRMDCGLFELFGIRFGWESLIGIIPAVGDVIGVLFALLIFKKCLQVEGGLNNSVKLRMLVNIALDFVVGLVPFVGDLADAAFKCNTKNLRLLERELDKKYKPNRRDERDFAGVDRETRRKNRASGIYLPNDPPPATAFEEFSDDEEDRRRAYAGADRVREPQRARTRDERVERQQSQRTRNDGVSRQASQRTRDDGVGRQPSKKGYGWFHSDRTGGTGSRRERPQEMREAR